MIEQIAAQFAFLGNFHPVAVHFPLALLPVAIAFKLWGWWRVQPDVSDMGQTLLQLSLLFALVAALLGMTNAQANGFAWSEIQAHATFAWLTIIVLTIAVFLPRYRSNHQNSGTIRYGLGRAWAGFRWSLAKIWWVLKWALLILFFPFVLVFLLLRKIYRVTLGKLLNPLFANAWHWVGDVFDKVWQKAKRFSTYQNWKNLGYATSLLLILVTGLHGAELVHGKGHLARHAPAWAAALLGSGEETIDATAFNAAHFETAVAPILRKNCMKCHGEDKAKGDVRLHTVDHIVASGVVRYKAPMDSEMIRRVLLSRDDPGAMPPKKNGRGLTSAEVATLLAWINDEVGGEGGGEHGPTIPSHYASISETLAPLGDNTIHTLNAHRAVVVRLQEQHSLLSVNLQFVEAADRAIVIKSLAPFSDHIVDLNAAGIEIDATLIDAIASMNNLVRLNLSRTTAGDREVAKLTGLRKLRWLNLYGSAITENADKTFKAMHNLETLHVGDTPLAPIEVAANDA